MSVADLLALVPSFVYPRCGSIPTDDYYVAGLPPRLDMCLYTGGAVVDRRCSHVAVVIIRLRPGPIRTATPPSPP